MSESLLAQYAAFVGKDIEFTEGVDDLEAYPEVGMRATVLSFKINQNNVGSLEVSYAKFDAYNAELETHNYYDRGHNPVLTAREAGCYTETEIIYTDAKPPFKLLSPELNAIMEEWKTDQMETKISYSAWVTQKLLEARLEVAGNAADNTKPEAESITYVTRLKP